VTTYGRSPWIDQFPKSRVPAFPRFRGNPTTDVVVIGGGLTGCATAYAFAAAGAKVILLEADRLGGGESGASAGWISTEPGTPFSQLERAVGAKSAHRAFQSWRRAALDFAALIRRLDIKCSLEPHETILVARTPEETGRVRREQKARAGAKLDVRVLNPRAIAEELALAGTIGLRAKDGATIDPYRATLGLAAAAAARGAALFERTPVRRVTFTRKIADVHTASAKIRTGRVIVATGMPTPVFRGLIRHFWFKTTYMVLTSPVPVKIRRQLGAGKAIVRDLADPPHMIRRVGEDRLLVMGADTPAAPRRQRDKVIVQRTGQLMYELSTIYPDISGVQPEYGWAADYGLSAEGIPYIGSHRNYPFHLFAFGDASHSVTGAYLASRIMLRQHLGEMDSADEVFAFRR